ncbi:hypothetical protein [uncultured Bacteroides sp.]|uniref:hypothetical protein n=1 Tax=uncultured Bacteroides sp. TaxID=162156 RepID=UPI002AA922CE|nr:hypothetical protein [uncultured Bacteroides sp.]
MRSKDLKPAEPARLLVIGEDSNLQWSDTATEVAMFADYYFRSFPEDHGERSRNVEARNLFNHLTFVTLNSVNPAEMYITNLCNDYVTPAPKGKRVLIPEEKAIKGLSHIEWLLEQYPTIECVLTMSLQTNYWLQKLGFYGDDEAFVNGAQPRRKGLESIEEPYYQPVDGKVFRNICGNIYDAKNHPVKVIPILAAKSYPLKDKDAELYSEAYNKIRGYFRK